MKTSLHVQIEAEINRSFTDVWAMVSDPTRLPEWLEEFVEVVQVSEGPVGEGTVFSYTLAPGPGERSSLLTLVEWVPRERLAWDGPPLVSRLGGARPRGSFEVAELSAGQSRFVSRYEPELSGVLAFMRFGLTRWLNRQRKMDTERLKGILERSDRAPAAE